MKRSLVAAALLLVAVGAQCQKSTPTNKNDNVVVYGLGNASCGVWVAARKSGPAQVTSFLGWVDGYITASGVLGNMRRADGAGVNVFIDKFCNEHPTETMFRAASALTENLRIHQ
jgi:hypothetical protein